MIMGMRRIASRMRGSRIRYLDFMGWDLGGVSVFKEEDVTE
jgi:hypothetical protein